MTKTLVSRDLASISGKLEVKKIRPALQIFSSKLFNLLSILALCLYSMVYCTLQGLAILSLCRKEVVKQLFFYICQLKAIQIYSSGS